ncbi:hypothetical protein NC652_017012 [Populus alba x Populus x berolinensis]|uniref:RlpA-like protein double-psi beta-barrel domain-containing protein n=1 Tax=Populus alba x Populus x berolinensis TaxID=444605 RepID=A0AAD6QPG5_9ROSI|nr:hypothetical protein NC652_017012 [Populus alba x Populus x berolinensis]KAJ6993973.1 hypothetical protein NC653_016951 [Populus alba x Populus x berolinensis]
MGKRILIVMGIFASLLSVAVAIPGIATFYTNYVRPRNPVPHPCTGKTVTVKVVDHCPGCPSTLDLSKEAFTQIANPVAGIINIEWIDRNPAKFAITAYSCDKHVLRFRKSARNLGQN